MGKHRFRLTRIDPVLTGICVGAIYAVGLLVVLMIPVLFDKGGESTPSLLRSMLSMYVVMVLLASLIATSVCYLYNLLVRWTGGIPVELSEETPEHHERP
ncbi:MAG TPA: hypothetical protein PKA51_11555 [Kiritimatiellia bacterium]|nr:hypothetical protein [Kiritimatiellia bacterium]